MRQLHLARSSGNVYVIANTQLSLLPSRRKSKNVELEKTWHETWESVSRSMMKAWTVAIAAHLTPVLINYRSCLSSAVRLDAGTRKSFRVDSCQDVRSTRVGERISCCPSKVHNPEVEGTAGLQYWHTLRSGAINSTYAPYSSLPIWNPSRIAR